MKRIKINTESDHNFIGAWQSENLDLMDKIIEETKDVAKVESKPKFEGRQMVMIIQPL